MKIAILELLVVITIFYLFYFDIYHVYFKKKWHTCLVDVWKR